MKHLLASSWRIGLIGIAAAAVSAAHGARAAPFVDAPGDFLPTYASPKDADLDARVVDVVIDPVARTITFFGSVAGPMVGGAATSGSSAATARRASASPRVQGRHRWSIERPSRMPS